MDEALKAKLAYENRQPKRKRKRMPDNKWAKFRGWFKLHPKVQGAFYAVALVLAVEGQGAFDGAETWQEAAHRTGEAAFVAIIAYLRKSKPSA